MPSPVPQSHFLPLSFPTNNKWLLATTEMTIIERSAGKKVILYAFDNLNHREEDDDDLSVICAAGIHTYWLIHKQSLSICLATITQNRA